MNPLPFWRIQYLFREYALDSLSFVQIHNEFTIFFAITLWIHCLFREFTIYSANSLSFWRIHYEFTWSFAIHNEFSRNNYEFTICLANLLPNHEFIIFNANSLQWSVFIANKVLIDVMFRGFTMNLLFISRIHYRFWRINYKNTSCFAKILRAHYFFREFIMLS